MQISFIIPIYNTEENLLMRCFNSILRLEDINYEVLLIDDGSKVFVKEFCERFVSEHSMFKYFKKSNEGVSKARNYGINKAVGKYLFFVDSDDAIVSDAFDKSLLNSDLDIIIFDLALVNTSRFIVWNSLKCNYGKVKNIDAILTMMYSTSLNSPCTKLIKRELVIKNQIYFNKNIVIGEDADFILNLLLLAPSIYYVDKVIYHYFIVSESSRKRIISNPEKLVDNYQYHILKKMGVIDQLEIDYSLKINAKVALISNEIKDVFNLTISLQEENLLSDYLKEKIIKLIKNIEKSILIKCKLATRFRYYILNKRMWVLMSKIQYIRKIYLKVRGLHI